MLRWLEVSSPDVACLQEIKCTNAAFPRKALEAAGYSAIWCGQGPHHGVAILARDVDPIETRRNLPGDSADREARYIEAAVNGVLYTAGMPDPDLLIRTAGEMRVSNFLLWQISYSEIWVTPRCWPDFDRETLHQALRDYAARERRFGGLT